MSFSRRVWRFLLPLLLAGMAALVSSVQALAQERNKTVAPAADQQNGAIPDDPAKALPLCMADGNPQLAVIACTRIIESGQMTGEKLGALLVRRGMAYGASNQLEAAIADFTAALKIKPDATDALYNRAAVYVRLDRLDLALADYDSVLKLAPNDADTFYQRAWVYARRGQDTAAIADLGAVLRQQPDDADALLDRGGLYIRSGQFAFAADDFSQIIKNNPKAAAAYYNRGRAAFAKGDFAAAASDFAAAYDARDGNPYAALRAYLALARLKSKTGDPKALLQKSLAKYGDGQWPAPIVSLYLGGLTPQALLQETAASTAQDAPRLRCEANYYLGEWALLKDDKKAAQDYFRAAVETGARNAIEFIDASLRLAGKME